MADPEFLYGDPATELSEVWLYASSPTWVDPGESPLDLAEEMAMARRGELPTGKWLVFVSLDEIAATWNNVAAAVSGGQLGDRAKVSTAAQNRNLDKEFVICIYSPWNNPSVVGQHLATIRSLGIDGRLSYKRDNETWVRSRGGNAWFWSPAGSEDVILTRYAKDWQPSS